MPRHVLAEEIEQFLGTVDGVRSARILTTPAGEISQIYVTAENLFDGRAVRRAVEAVLSTTYGLPVEPWRIQVTQFRAGLGPAEIPQFRLIRVEESVSASEASAVVQVAWIRGGEERTAVGRARGPSGPSNRIRTLAAATLDAARTALDAAHRRMTLEQVSLVTFLGRPTTLVGISVATSRGPEIVVGSAVQEDETAEAVIPATLDALTKWLFKASFASADPGRADDRRARLEAMRHFVRSSERGGAAPVPAGEPRAAPEEAVSGDATAEQLYAEDAPPETMEPAVVASPATVVVPPNSDSPERADRGAVLTLPLRSSTQGPGPGDAVLEEPDIVVDFAEIRPEKKGGAEMAVPQEPTRAGIVPPRAGRPSMEDTFYQTLVEERTPVHLRCRDGYEIPRAILKDVGTYTLLVEAGGGTELVYKHAIISIRLLPTTAPEA